jgi:Big-like domain-containing protein/galactose oxidase-like protein
LPAGRVLVVAGHDGSTFVGGIDVYDPSTGTFDSFSILSADANDATSVSTAQVAAARTGHQVTILADHRILITGGQDENGVFVARAEVYDTATGTFTPVGYLLTPRADHRAVRLPDGRVMLLGGVGADGTVLERAEFYDPLSGRFMPAPSLTEPRTAPIAAVLEEGHVLVAGGIGAAGQLLATSEVCRCAPPSGPRVGTSTQLTSDRSSSVYGSPITYMARVTSAAGVPSGAVQFFDGDALLGTAWLNADGQARLTVSRTPAGTRSITARYSGSSIFSDSTSPALSQSVAKGNATTSFTITPIQRQYSDRVTFVATVSPPTAAQSVTFKTGAAVLGTAPVVAGTATLNIPLSTNAALGSRIITAVFNQDAPNYTTPSVSRSMSIMKEDARVTQHVYNTTVYTACRTCSKATVVLRATVKDISATLEANGDVSPGDIRNATFVFVDRSTYATIATVPVTLVNPNDATVGEAVYTWYVDLGTASSKTFKVGYQVGGFYNRSSYDYVTVTVSKPK